MPVAGTDESGNNGARRAVERVPLPERPASSSPWQAPRRRGILVRMSERVPASPYPESQSGEIVVDDPGPTPMPFVDPARDLDAVREVAATRRVLLAEIGKRIVGQEKVIDHLLVALFARGHCLFVG